MDLREQFSEPMNAGVLLEICNRIKSEPSPTTSFIESRLREMTDRTLPHIDYVVPETGLDHSEIPSLQISTLLQQCEKYCKNYERDTHTRFPEIKYREFLDDCVRSFTFDVTQFIYNEFIDLSRK